MVTSNFNRVGQYYGFPNFTIKKLIQGEWKNEIRAFKKGFRSVNGEANQMETGHVIIIRG